jgi:hypothetical protein
MLHHASFSKRHAFYSINNPVNFEYNARQEKKEWLINILSI